MLYETYRAFKQLFGPGYADYVGGATIGDLVSTLGLLWRNAPLLDGPEIEAYESALSRYHEGASAFCFGAGNMALYAILKAMNLEEGQEVILPGYTCVVVPNAIRFAGLTPVYADVSLNDFNIIPELIEAAITPRTGAILAQATFGIPCDMDALRDISTRTGVPIIEDGAHGIGARWKGRLLGECGAAAFFSTQATKMFSTERGGYAVTRDPELGRRLREIQSDAQFNAASFERAAVLRWCYRVLLGKPFLYPRLRWFERSILRRVSGRMRAILDHDAEQYRDAVAGRRISPYPARLGNLMAHAGTRQLERVERDVARRRALVEVLEAELPGLGAGVAEYDRDKVAPSWVRFPFVVADRAEWIPCMRASGLAPGVWLDDPIHPRESDRRTAGYADGQCPNGEFLSNHILNVPLHRGVSARRLEKWLAKCRKLRRTPIREAHPPSR